MDTLLNPSASAFEFNGEGWMRLTERKVGKNAPYIGELLVKFADLGFDVIAHSSCLAQGHKIAGQLRIEKID